MIEFAAGVAVGAFGLASLCAIFRTNGKDWGEPVCGEPVPGLDDTINLDDMEAMAPQAHLEAVRDVFPDKVDLDIPTYLRRQSGDPTPPGRD